jgi:phosphoribosylglycinamide formyltransferase-1
MIGIGFLASGNGSSAQAIVRAAAAGELAVTPRLMVSNRKDAPALGFAREQGFPALCIPTQADPDAADRRLADALADHDVELVVMSGYLRRLGPVTLARYAGRVLNIHPGPIPQFGGEGMYGRRVHEAVIAAGVAESGVVIHVVDEEYDHGPVLARRAVPLAPGETADSLEARIRDLEPAFFVETLRRIARGELALP